MRHRFTQQISLGIHPIEETKVPTKSRDELPPVIAALHYIFITPELNEKVFTVLENKITKNKKATGRRGMDLWQIFVLAVVRHALGTNWDRLEYIANQDRLVRQILGVYGIDWKLEEIEFAYQTIVDNVSLIDEDMLAEINQIVARHGHQLLKKKDEGANLKSDTYVLETNVHFPTDLNLLWDSLRKGLDVIEQMRKEDSRITGWRKIKSIRRDVKRQFRKTSQSVFKGRNEKAKRESVKAYVRLAKQLEKRMTDVASSGIDAQWQARLNNYQNYITILVDQIERRLLKGETIAPEEKVFSIFEPHTEWINKGKQHPSFELGHNLLITTDQHHLIMDYKVMVNEKDVHQVKELYQRLAKNYPEMKIASHSFDKGFYSAENIALLKDKAAIVVLPKRGKLSDEEKETERSKTFVSLRHAHSAIESNINMLEHHGLNRCVDKGLHGYKRYVGLSVLAYNLHIIGNHLMAKEKEEREKKKRRSAA